MREIKFRAWDKGNMFTVDSTTFKQGKLHCFFQYNTRDDGKLKAHKISDDAIVMQYTGLKDKNGKEIYEGDIVKWVQPCYWGNDYELTCQVEFEEKDAGFRPFYGYYVVDNGNIDDNQIPNSSLKFEVIGNIYENPELMNV